MPVAPNDELALIWAPTGKWMIIYDTPGILPQHTPDPIIGDTRKAVMAAFAPIKRKLGTRLLAAYLFNDKGYVTTLLQPPHRRDTGYW